MKASVLIITYNQEKYIRQTIESVLNQETSFPFEIIIGDDCSTDYTLSICQEFEQKYPDQIRILKPDKNQGFLKNFVDCYNAAGGIYVGATAGDDYWTDIKKLQKQIDFLEANPDYSMCCTGFSYLYEDTLVTKEFLEEGDKDVKYQDLLYNNPIIPTTVVYKKSFIPILEDAFLQVPVEDWVLWLMYSKFGKIRYLNFNSAMYRQHSESMYSGLSSGKKALWRFKTAVYINEKFRKQDWKEFIRTEKFSVKEVFGSKDLTRKEKLDFYKKLIDFGLTPNFILKIFIGNNAVQRRVSYRIITKMLN